MGKHFKTKFFYIITALTLAAVIFPTVLVSMGHGGIFRSAVNTVFTPLKKLSVKIVDGIDGYASYFTEYDRLVEENEALKKEIAELKEEVHSTRQLQEQYEWLSEFLDIKMQHSDYELLSATVCGRESGNYGTVLMLDRGTSAGVAVGMTVITGDGVLGSITEVGINWAKATTLTESSSAIGVYDERSGEVGVMKGEYGLSKSGQCRMTYIEENADIKVGDRILTAGYGSIYPRGLIIGYVTEISRDEFSRGLTAIIDVEAAEKKISDVMVIVGYEK